MVTHYHAERGNELQRVTVREFNKGSRNLVAASFYFERLTMKASQRLFVVDHLTHCL